MTRRGHYKGAPWDRFAVGPHTVQSVPKVRAAMAAVRGQTNRERRRSMRTSGTFRAHAPSLANAQLPTANPGVYSGGGRAESVVGRGRLQVDIGKPKRTVTVEPITEPVPRICPALPQLAPKTPRAPEPVRVDDGGAGLR